MFTGIVQGTGTITALEKKERALSFVVDLGERAQGVSLGASVAIAGVCLTVISIDDSRLGFDVMGETLDKTSLSSLRVGDKVNGERSAKMGDEIGGHVMSGHIVGMAKISAIDAPTNNHVVTLACDPRWMPYILPKGFIGLDGCSLTIVDVGPDWFTVHLIPETLARTTFGQKRVGDTVNLEIDAMTRATVDTVKRYLKTT
jgi:riboflavin synthase